MSVYYCLGCAVCKERVYFTSSSMGGFGWMGGAVEEVPSFMEKHTLLGHENALCVFSEFDYRYDDYSRFDLKLYGSPE